VDYENPTVLKGLLEANAHSQAGNDSGMVAIDESWNLDFGPAFEQPRRHSSGGAN
jgi:hypothetical protein